MSSLQNAYAGIVGAAMLIGAERNRSTAVPALSPAQWLTESPGFCRLLSRFMKQQWECECSLFTLLLFTKNEFTSLHFEVNILQTMFT